MNSTRRCPNCGSEIATGAPEQLCPRCLLSEGLATGTEGTDTVPLPEGWTPPEEIAANTVVESTGRYSYLGEHARGGMGRVLLVHDEYLERDIALKELLPFPVRVDIASANPRSPIHGIGGPLSPGSAGYGTFGAPVHRARL